jgi:ActR/RegA family two-component response regulator
MLRNRLNSEAKFPTTRPTVEVALVTGWASTATTAAAAEAGVRRVFAKPVDFGVLIPLVEEVVGHDQGS